jgi:hypothetical protein
MPMEMLLPSNHEEENCAIYTGLCLRDGLIESDTQQILLEARKTFKSFFLRLNRFRGDISLLSARIWQMKWKTIVATNQNCNPNLGKTSRFKPEDRIIQNNKKQGYSKEQIEHAVH